MLALVVTSFAASAQTPEFTLKIDLRPTYMSERGDHTTFRWYDSMGRHSTIGLQLNLEPGYRIWVSQRLQKIDNDPDRDQLDEYYLEDPGNWRLGRQYLPFGDRILLRSSAMAARLDTQLLLAALPIAIAYADGGKGKVRGVVGRIGRGFGVSVAVGDHFGISASDLTPIRSPEAAPGRGRGYRFVLGGDYGQRFGPILLEGEYAAFRRGSTELDADLDVSDLRATVSPATANGMKLTGAWSREWRSKEDFYRIEGELPIGPKLQMIPFVRFARGDWERLGITVRIRF
ncbi:MAG TPA: hypothetical protein PLH94_00740 [Fimbriimonadaceae bacterium]|nr:hypothetical protein [Fimbriimonadaceae bacterium]